MGSDIHLVVEKKISEKWVAISIPECYVNVDGDFHYPLARRRNYNRFTRLANVRGDDGYPPKGLPTDISETTRALTEEWGEDGHSHTWHWLRDAANIFKNTEDGRPSGGRPEIGDIWNKHPEYAYFGVEEENDDDYDNYRIVIWFDN